MRDNEAKARVKSAEDDKSASGGGAFDSSSLEGGHSDDDAADLYIQAGNMYKMAEMWKEAGDAFARAAEIKARRRMESPKKCPGPKDNQVDALEGAKQMTFDDLPDIAILQVMERSDLASQLKLRLMNKRMNNLQLQVKNNLDEIYLNIEESDYELYVMPWNRGTPYESGDFEALARTLERLAVNTRVESITFALEDDPTDETIVRIVEALLSFKADELRVEQGVYDLREEATLPQVNLSTLLNFAQNIRTVEIDCECPLLTIQDFCAIRKTMLEGGCKMEILSINPQEGMQKEFVKECFGVTVKDVYKRRRASRKLRRIYRTEDESVELYLAARCGRSTTLHHFEGELHTSVGFNQFCLEKCKNNGHFEKIEFNIPYEQDGWYDL